MLKKIYSLVEYLDNKNLCIGCGLCESISGKDTLELEMQKDGFYHPTVKRINKEDELIIGKICPGINIVNDIKFNQKESIWGKIEKTYTGYANDSILRKKSSSGGIVSAIAIHLLETKQVDAILHIGVESDNYKVNRLRISKSKDEVSNFCSSRYAPALVFSDIKTILENNNDNYCFIGKPCDISALKNFLNVFPKYKNRFRLFISIFCAGMPSINATEIIINSFGAKSPIYNLVYRGNGWPGSFSFQDEKKQEYKMSYNESWGTILGKYVHFRCKICPDGIGIQADIAVGDAWETKDGYPDFEEKDGRSLIIARTQLAIETINKAFSDKSIAISEIDVKDLKAMQPYQYFRRKFVGARILAFTIRRGFILNFKNLKIFNNLLRARPRTIISQFIGSVKRS